MCENKNSVEAMAEKIRGGDYNDFGKLLHLCAYIPKNVLSEAQKLGYEKEDIYQESVVAFLHALHSYDEKNTANFKTFASVCIKNHIFSILRTGRRPKNSAMVDYVSIEDIDLASKSEPEADWIEKETFSNMKKRIFEVLSEFEKQVLKLYLGGFSYKEIGEKLGKPEKSIGNALSRVRKKLRTEIGPEN